MTASLPVSAMIVDTAVGPVGIAWNERGLVRVQLPARDTDATRRALAARLGGAIEFTTEPPDSIAALADLLRRYAEGEEVDFSGVAVDLAGLDPFRQAIYRAARKLAHGETTTYGALAAEAGFGDAARDTGTAMGRNPVPLVVPCHRVLAAGGKIGGFSAPGGPATKEKLLALEGVRVGPPEPAQASFAF